MTDTIDKSKTPPGWWEAIGGEPGLCVRDERRVLRKYAWRMFEEEAEVLTAPLKARIAELEAELAAAKARGIELALLG